MIDGYISHNNTKNSENNNYYSNINFYFLISALSIVGIPLTAGFISKFYLFDLTLNTHHYVASFVIILSSLITALYIWRLNKILLKKNIDNINLPKILHIPLLMCATLNLTIGIYPKPIINILKLITYG
jgi:NADH:ubiquinone oxidoreductase subunit 2 (subunit N)